MNTKILFETFDNKIYEVFCDQIEMCSPNKCTVIYKFDDGKMFDIDRERKAMFAYVREKYKETRSE